MEETNINESLDKRSLILDVENTEQNNNLNDRSCLVDDDANVLIQEQAIIVDDETETNIVIDLSRENDVNIPSNIVIHHDYDMETANKPTTRTETSRKSSKKKSSRYLSTWEQQPESFYKTYTFDIYNIRHEKLL